MSAGVVPTPRKRGRAGQRDRERRRRRDPLCVLCLEKDLVEPTTQIDHIVRLADGGPDTDENTRGLCDACHDKVTHGHRGYDENGKPLDPSHPWGGGA